MVEDEVKKANSGVPGRDDGVPCIDGGVLRKDLGVPMQMK